MQFPDYIDEEDMRLFKKELKLAGYVVDERFPSWGGWGKHSLWIQISERGLWDQDVNPLATYKLRIDGWERVDGLP